MNEQFGEDWKEEVMRNRKEDIVELYKQARIELEQLKEGIRNLKTYDVCHVSGNIEEVELGLGNDFYNGDYVKTEDIKELLNGDK